MGSREGRQGWHRAVLAATIVAISAGALTAQEFHPPRVRSGDAEGTRLGLYGFGVRGGLDLTGSAQFVFGVAFDAGNLGSSRLRLRPSGEIGVFNGVNSYIGSFEAAYRFAGDQEKVTPYVGGGLSLVGHDHCGADPGCPTLWANALIGFELHYRSTFSWLVEYHGMRAFTRSRIYVGLTTRRGS